jgi:hypothetical protein
LIFQLGNCVRPIYVIWEDGRRPLSGVAIDADTKDSIKGVDGIAFKDLVRLINTIDTSDLARLGLSFRDKKAILSAVRFT